MSCDEVRDLTGAYALGTVSAEEKRLIEDHLVSCELHAEIAGLVGVVYGLSSAAPEIEPPARLAGQISAAIRDEPDAEAISLKPRVIRPVWSRVTRLTAWPVAAAFAVAIGALVIWNVNMQLNDPPENLVHFMKEADGVWVRIEA